VATRRWEKLNDWLYVFYANAGRIECRVWHSPGRGGWLWEFKDADETFRSEGKVVHRDFEAAAKECVNIVRFGFK
jgi:hypothetical protein